MLALIVSALLQGLGFTDQAGNDVVTVFQDFGLQRSFIFLCLRQARYLGGSFFSGGAGFFCSSCKVKLALARLAGLLIHARQLAGAVGSGNAGALYGSNGGEGFARHPNNAGLKFVQLLAGGGVVLFDLFQDLARRAKVPLLQLDEGRRARANVARHGLENERHVGPDDDQRFQQQPEPADGGAHDNELFACRGGCAAEVIANGAAKILHQALGRNQRRQQPKRHGAYHFLGPQFAGFQGVVELVGRVCLLCCSGGHQAASSCQVSHEWQQLCALFAKQRHRGSAFPAAVLELAQRLG